MLKYIKQHMAGISGIEIYPIISFVIFFLFFLGVALWAWKGNKQYFEHMAKTPLDQD